MPRMWITKIEMILARKMKMYKEIPKANKIVRVHPTNWGSWKPLFPPKCFKKIIIVVIIIIICVLVRSPVKFWGWKLVAYLKSHGTYKYIQTLIRKGYLATLTGVAELSAVAVCAVPGPGFVLQMTRPRKQVAEPGSHCLLREKPVGRFVPHE